MHLESLYRFDLGNSSYARALLGDKRHWVRRLPGKLLQNIISHGIARIAEFLTSDDPQVIAYGFRSQRLKELNETELMDELRVVISQNERTTAYFTFSSQMKPSMHQLRIYGPKNGLILDQAHEMLIRLPGASMKSYANMFVPPMEMAKQRMENFWTNAKIFWTRDFQLDSGMKALIEAFYKSIQEDAPLPISSREIVLTAKIMDTIFAQLRANAPDEPGMPESLASAQVAPALKS